MTDIGFSMAQEQIKELRADNARLRTLSVNNAISWDTIVRERDELRAEIERLRRENKWLYNQIAAQKRTAGAAAVAALEQKT